MKGFPHTTFFGLWKRGWKVLSKGKWQYEKSRSQKYCEKCQVFLYQGQDHDGSLFKYCPRCMVKIK